MTARRSWVALALVAVLAALADAGCDEGEDEGAGRASSVTATVPGLPRHQVDEAVRGLCRAREQATADVNSARTTFYDRSHEPLHAIARALEPVDRPLAGRLLEAKEAVEADLASPARAPSLTPDLDRLLDVTRAGLARLSVASPSCP